MKTTVEISDELFAVAKEAAHREGSTLRALIEEGLHVVLERRREPRPFALREASFGGRGLQPGVSEGSWERIRELIYEGRGG
jgi:hypothetical protein